MVWTIEFDERAEKDLSRLDRPVQRTLLRYLRERIAAQDDPRVFGKELKHEFAGVWRYRVGDYRILCRIEERELVVFVIAAGHRKDVYEGPARAPLR